MKQGSYVKLKNCGRIGVVVSIEGNQVEVRLLSGSKVIADRSFYNLINSIGGVSYGHQNLETH